jgi:hypothetical protein
MGRRVRCPFLTARVHSSTTSQHSFCFPENCIYGRYRYQKMMKIVLLLCLVGVALGRNNAGKCKKRVKETIKLTGAVPAFVETFGVDRSSFNNDKLKIDCCCQWKGKWKKRRRGIYTLNMKKKHNDMCKRKCVQSPDPVNVLGLNGEIVAIVRQTGKDTKVGYKNVFTIPSTKSAVYGVAIEEKAEVVDNERRRRRRKLLQDGNGNC